MVDNWKYFADKLNFTNPTKFYLVQLQQRKKDDESFSANNRTIKSYFINTREEFLALESEIKKLSDETKSRVYIRLNRRSFEDVALQVNKDLAQMLQDRNFQHLKSLVPSAAGNVCSEKKEDRLWLIDIDDMSYFDKVIDFLFGIDPGIFEDTIETLHGVHIITHKFDSKLFKEKFPNIDLHKDNPTLLYFNPDAHRSNKTTE